MRGDTPRSGEFRELQREVVRALTDLDEGRPEDAAERLRRVMVEEPELPAPQAEPGDPSAGVAEPVPSPAGRLLGVVRAVAAAARELRTAGPDGRVGRAIRALDTDPGTVSVARSVRRRLPGDAAYGDPLSLDDRGAGLLGQRLATVAGGTPSAARELAFGALQVWEGLPGRRRAETSGEVAVLFTDLVGFSGWVLEVGDPAALAELRRIGARTEPEITSRGGAVVKRLGDGVMAVFDDVAAAVDAALAVVAQVEDDPGDLRLRAGVHVGTPLRLGADFFGADVNIAARVGAAAGPGEVLVSDRVRAALPAGYRLRRLGGLRAKGVPRGVSLHRVERAA